MTDRYTPPPVPGYVHYSNYGKHRDGKEWTPETIEASISSECNIPRADICVVPFTPVGFAPNGGIKWAAHVKQEHGHVVTDMLAHLAIMMEALKTL